MIKKKAQSYKNIVAEIKPAAPRKSSKTPSPSRGEDKESVTLPFVDPTVCRSVLTFCTWCNSLLKCDPHFFPRHNLVADAPDSDTLLFQNQAVHATRFKLVNYFQIFSNDWLLSSENNGMEQRNGTPFGEMVELQENKPAMRSHLGFKLRV